MPMQTKYINIRQFRAQMASLYEEAAKHGWRYVVLSRNEPLFEVRPLTSKDKERHAFVFDARPPKKISRGGGTLPKQGRVDVLVMS